MILKCLLLALLVAGCFAIHTAEEWENGRVVYQVLTDRYARTNGDTSSCNDIRRYCGGTFKGLENNLDKIADLGFNAIWISPIVSQIDANDGDGFHGYWFKDIYEINSHFGTSEDLKSLVKAAHAKDIWIMLDVVFNHPGPIGNDFSQINPFNKPEHYHSDCEITNWNDQNNVEYCRLSGLPDLAQSGDNMNQWVHDTLISWIEDVVKEYDIDGLRCDTVPEVHTTFWDDMSAAIDGGYAVGEVYNGREDYVASYTHHLPAVLSYPMFFTLNNVFINRNDMSQIESTYRSYENNVRDILALGTFAENHDQPRFLHQRNDVKAFASMLAYTLTADGVPIMYYGAEKGFNGANDPYNREPYWSRSGYDSYLYQVIKAIATLRKENKEEWGSQKMTFGHVEDDLITYWKGKVFTTLTNVGSDGAEVQRYAKKHPYAPGETVCNVVWGAKDCVVIENDGTMEVALESGEPKVWVPKSWVQ
ncbi:alpha-amylase [Carpediemonas membranifera]|uniref:alpha-amylase n=1 Tax=Carpediemonas membranifera TaxID=201153 RepID=A0A8J6AZQ0_9EUKA|nr:alpha-amylase [Carpediemonas membranifera]|eukprot:KAG9392343.1 alpha-amylase [Carpediemonas membranifera]